MIRITKTMVITGKSRKYYLNINYRGKYNTRIEIDEETHIFLPKILTTRSIQETIQYLKIILPVSPKTRSITKKLRERLEKLEQKFLAEKNIHVDTKYLDDLDPKTQDILLIKRYVIKDKGTHLQVLVINPFYADSVIEIIVSKGFMITPEKYIEEEADLNYLNYARKALNLVTKTRDVDKEIRELVTALEKYVPLAKMLRKLEHKK